MANPGVAALDAAGWQVHTHAIGDRAARTALDAFAHAADMNGDTDNRHTVAHLELVNEDDLGRFGELGVLACMQMQWAELDSYTVDYTKPYVGAKRWRYLYPSGSIAERGGMLTGGSDWPVDPLLAVPPDRDGRESRGRRDLSLLSRPAPRAGAHTQARLPQDAHRELGVPDAPTGDDRHDRGGQEGRLIVLDRDVESVPLKDVSTTEVLLTLLDGVAVHRSNHL